METTNEILVNEDTVDVVEEIVKSDSKKMLGLGIIGGVVITGLLAYRFIAKPLIAKAKAKKEDQDNDVHTLDEDEYEEFDPDYDQD